MRIWEARSDLLGDVGRCTLPRVISVGICSPSLAVHFDFGVELVGRRLTKVDRPVNGFGQE